MTQLFWTVILATFMLFHPMPWQNKALANNSEPDCETLVGDDSEETTTKPATFLGEDGKLYISNEAYVYAGQPVYTKKFSAPTLVEASGSPGDTAASITVNKFLHDGKYHTARIPLDSAAIESVYTQTMPFPIIPGVMAGHVQARFVMNPGYEIELLDAEGKVTTKIKDMIISYEAALPPDASYNFALGAVDANPLVGRLVSGQQKLDEGPEREFRQYLLPLTRLEKAQLLSYYIRDSIKIKMDLYYNTVVRNCTTTVFDGIDSLPRFQKLTATGQLDPFLTTIGGDPVIGPAVNALLERFGKQVTHVQDMKDEYKGQFTSFGPPDPVTADRLPFAPGGEAPMSLLVTTQGSERLSTDEKKVIDEMVEDIIHDLPETMNMLLASAFSVAEDLEKSPQIVQAITKVITDKLNDRLKGLKGNLPEDGITVQVMFTPFETGKTTTDLRSRGLRAQLPFDLERMDLLPSNKSGVFEQIQTGIDQVDSRAPADLPAYLKTFSVHIFLKNTGSEVNTQILMGLQPTEKPVDIKNSQVELDTFRIPKPQENHPSRWERLKNALNPWADDEELHSNVNLLLSHRQELESETNTHAFIRFGASPQIQDNGMLLMPRVAESRYLCWSGTHPHTPQLLGRLAASPLGQQGWLSRTLNGLLSGRRVSLSITDLEMNLQALEIKTTRIRIGVLGLRCIDLDSVNQQFGEQANEKLQELMSNINAADIQLP